MITHIDLGRARNEGNRRHLALLALARWRKLELAGWTGHQWSAVSPPGSAADIENVRSMLASSEMP